MSEVDCLPLQNLMDMDMSEITSEVSIEPSAIAVDLPDDLFVLCHEVLPEAGLIIHRAGHAHAACERIAVLLPQLVVVPATMKSSELDLVEDRAIAVGAIVLHLDPDHGYDVLTAQLAETVRQVRSRFRGR